MSCNNNVRELVIEKGKDPVNHIEFILSSQLYTTGIEIAQFGNDFLDSLTLEQH